ncbi:MAG: bifunctional phosphopantothenoylcysteine decarboxylase/phosphopantothenate synthase [Gemmataceae bacterium]
MKILITGGQTEVPIDAVRLIAGPFTGRTGLELAREAHQRGHHVTLALSRRHAQVAPKVQAALFPRWRIREYATVAELWDVLYEELSGAASERYDVVIHAAAVSDYLVQGVFRDPNGPSLCHPGVGKVSSDYPVLWIKLVPAPKLIDRLRSDCGFTGRIVMFKLESQVGEAELQARAEKARLRAGADLVVANTVEERLAWVLIGPVQDRYLRVPRADLPKRLFDILESIGARHAEESGPHSEGGSDENGP